MRRKKSTTTLENVAQSIGSTVGIALRTAGDVADTITLAAKKVEAKMPRKKARKKLVSRAKKLVGASLRRVKASGKAVVRSTKSAKRAVSKLRKK
jgi:hypothetical protein